MASSMVKLFIFTLLVAALIATVYAEDDGVLGPREKRYIVCDDLGRGCTRSGSGGQGGSGGLPGMPGLPGY